MTTDTAPQSFAFQAEIKQLLHLLSHSLYQNREIALRELVSNASDALDKMRHIALTDEAYRDDAPLEICVDPKADDKLLIISDNGVGMTHDELVTNLGTIAHSGSLDFLKNLSGDAKQDVSLVGQFGVGFYSAFMLADKVEVLTRSYREEQGWRWESDGSGTFTIEPAEGLDRGTQVRLHLRSGMEEFTNPTRVRYILQQYSTFVPHPLKLDGEQINNQRPIWVEPKAQLTQEQYDSFYQYLTHRASEKPLWRLHFSSDSPFQFHAILYCPPSNFERLGFGRIEHGLHLCAKRILVQNDCDKLLPEYLRFLYGLVDSADLPLNVSREALQDNTVFRKIRKVLVKKVLDHLDDMAANDAAAYRTFYDQFGSILREGVHNDFENRERIARLLRFQSSHTIGDELTSLEQYLERAGENQKQIYYISGPSLESIRNSPHLEIFRKKNLEVLYLTDPVDEFVLSTLMVFKEKRLTNVEGADLEFPETESGEKDATESGEDKASESEAAEKPAGLERVLSLFREALAGEVADVKESRRLTDSPCCLVNSQGAMSLQLQKVLSMTHKDFEMSQRTLEINPQSPLIRRLCALSSNDDHAEFIKDSARLLHDSALLQAGIAPHPEETVSLLHKYLHELATTRSPIIH